MNAFLDWLEGKKPATPPATSATPEASAAFVAMLTTALAIVAPKASAETWVTALTSPMEAAEITTPQRVAAFFGQMAVESLYFTKLEENLHYSAERAYQVFRGHFSSVDEAQPYAMQPEKLANRVYANRMGNGDVASGDGWRYRGGGLLDTTGKANYQGLAKATGKTVEDTPAWVRAPAGAAASAVYYWQKNDLNALADAWQITNVTHAVNGGFNGLQERIALSNAALKALQPTAAMPATV
jgi:putative chitinase